MDFCRAAQEMNLKIERSAAKISIQRKEYEEYLAEANRRSKELLTKILNHERDLEQMKNNLSEVEKKKKAQARTLDRHLYSRRLNHMFTRSTWMQRDFIYRKMLETNDRNMDIFNCSITIDNIDQSSFQYFESLIRSRVTLREQIKRQRGFFNWPGQIR